MTKNVSGAAFAVVRDAIESYQRHAENEPWKIDHDAAMKCYDLEEMLWVGNGIFDAITQFDENYRARCFAGVTEYDTNHPNTIKEAYAWWLRPSKKIRADIEKCLQRFGHVENSEGFLSRCREAEGILTEDASFFTGLVNLRDEAIDDLRAGNVSECRGN